MTNVYTVATTVKCPPGLDCVVAQITSPANTEIKIKKIRITPTDGTDTTVNDFHRNIKLLTESAAGTGGTAYTPIDIDDNNTAAVSTVKTGPMGIGTISATIDQISLHSGTDFFWQAADEDDKIVIKPGEIFGLVVNSST